MLRLFDTLTGEKQDFHEREPGKVGIYVCGPTVYDHSHLGHARVYVVFDTVVRYLRQHPEVTSVLFTGGDPMVMRAPLLARWIEPLLALDTLRSIRIGTKALAWWPQRFVADRDADEVLRLFERVVGFDARLGQNLLGLRFGVHPGVGGS